MSVNDTKRGSSRERGFLAPATFRTVVVPLDLTPVSDRILRRLALLPLADDARVMLLHVVPGSLLPGEQRSAKRDADRALADEKRHLRKSLPGNARIEPLVKRGGVATEIGACATRAKAQLIVMGRGGRRALREAFLGSTAERVIRKSRLPVLVVGRPREWPTAGLRSRSISTGPRTRSSVSCSCCFHRRVLRSQSFAHLTSRIEIWSRAAAPRWSACSEGRPRS